MLAGVRRRLSYANVMATIAVFLALGTGGAYAVTQIDKNSVHSKHIVNGQVKAPDIAVGAATANKIAANAVNSGKVLDGSLQARDFAAGQLPDPFVDQLPSGETLTGYYAMGGTADAPGEIMGVDSISFAYRLETAPTPHFVTSSASVPECPGQGQAAPGHLCVYEQGNGGVGGVDQRGFLATPVSRYGAALLVRSAADGGGNSFGSWAVTAP